ncbi:MAG TPA: hypothetical protein VGI74_21760 [Streptosporangiaceae bacterium]
MPRVYPYRMAVSVNRARSWGVGGAGGAPVTGRPISSKNLPGFAAVMMRSIAGSAETLRCACMVPGGTRT